MKLVKTIVTVVCALICVSCQKPDAVTMGNVTNVIFDSAAYTTYADTIINDMVVKNPDADDKWLDACLRGFKRDAFIDSLFQDMYAEKLVVLDYTTNRRLTVQEIKKAETASGYNRDIIGKFQFCETWRYNRATHSMIKQVHSIIFGYETYDQTGFVKGYKPLFKIVL